MEAGGRRSEAAPEVDLLLAEAQNRAGDPADGRPRLTEPWLQLPRDAVIRYQLLRVLGLELLHLRCHYLSDRAATAAVPEETPDQVASDQDCVALPKAFAALPGQLVPGRDREREDSLAGFRHLQAEPGHTIP